MKILKKLWFFLIGPSPNIFDENGKVVHKHPKKKWEAWQSRYKNDPQLNWRDHTGARSH